jgi:DoxX-like protein
MAGAEHLRVELTRGAVMFIAYAVVGILLALGVLASAAAQISRNKVILENLAHLGIPRGMLPFLATCLIAGGVGLMAGLWYPPLGIAAAVGLVLYFVGALIAHVRKGDVKGLPAPMLFLILAGVALSLQLF